MLSIERLGDVTRLRMHTLRSRALGFDASAYLMRGILVDTGFPAAGGDLASWLDAERLRGVIVTHHHEDHAGNIELVASRGLPVVVSEATLRAVRAPAPIRMFRRICWGSPAPLASPVTPFDTDGLALLPLPGHCADHAGVWDAATRTLFAADLFLGVKVRIAQDTEDIPALLRSLRAVIALEPRRVFCTHRGLVRDPVNTLRKKADWLQGIIEAARHLRAKGVPTSAIARQLLGREGAIKWFTQGELSKENLVRSIIGSAQ